MDDEVLRSTRNRRVAEVAALHAGAERRATGLHLAEGLRVCREALAAAEVVELFHTGSLPEGLGPIGEPVRVREVDDRVMARLSDAATPPGVLAVVRTPDPGALPRTGPILLLEDVADPGNVGTLVRTAAAFGMDVVRRGGADPYGPKAVRASAGACYRTSIHTVADDVSITEVLRGDGRTVIGLAADASHTLDDIVADLPVAGGALVLGSEPRGLSERSRAQLDLLARIPMRGPVESLNVAAAGAIAMHALAGR